MNDPLNRVNRGQTAHTAQTQPAHFADNTPADARHANGATHRARPGAHTRQQADSNAVHIRRLHTERDIEATWPLFLALHRESRYAGLHASQTKRADYLRENMLGKPDRFGMLIAEWRGQPVGFLTCAANHFLYGDQIIASCLSFYVLPAHRKTLLGGRIALKLLHAYRRWALNRQAVEIQFHVTSGIGIARTDLFMRRAGFHQTGGNYSLALLARAGGEGR